MKTVLAPMFAHRNLKVMSWVGHNIFGNRDGLILDDPANKSSKVETKDRVVTQILGYKPSTLVTIEYLPDMGDWKTAWDHIHFQGFLGTKMALQFTWQGCDSLLAAPLAIDLARLADLEKQRGGRGLLQTPRLLLQEPRGRRGERLLQAVRAARSRTSTGVSTRRPDRRRRPTPERVAAGKPVMSDLAVASYLPIESHTRNHPVMRLAFSTNAYLRYPVRRGRRADRRARLRGAGAAGRRPARLAGRAARRARSGPSCDGDGADRAGVLEHQRVHDERGQRLPPAVLVSVVHRARPALPPGPDRPHPAGPEPLRRAGCAPHHDRARRAARPGPVAAGGDRPVRRGAQAAGRARPRRRRAAPDRARARACCSRRPTSTSRSPSA